MAFRFGEIEPMRCARADAPFDDPAFAFEPKLDGVRAIAYAGAGGRVRLQGRSGRDLTADHPDAARAVAAALDGLAAVLDGEVCALDARGAPSFSALQRRAGEVAYFAFDVLAVDGVALLPDPLETRRQALHELAADLGASFRIVDFLPGSGTAAFHAAVGLGFEGVVAKRLGSAYVPGARSRDWVKVKKAATADLVVGAWIPGAGALAGTVGALCLGAFDDAGRLRYVGRVGTGFARNVRDAYREALAGLAARGSPFADPLPAGARFVRPALVVEVEFLEVTRDGKLRAPAFRGARPDKSARECLLAAELPAFVA